jgi:hypothetical protein
MKKKVNIHLFKSFHLLIDSQEKFGSHFENKSMNDLVFQDIDLKVDIFSI